jgi:hypothetical protein
MEDYRQYARVIYANGEHDPGKAASEYLHAALESDDPFQALLPAVKVAFRDAYRGLRKEAEDLALPWDWNPAQHHSEDQADGSGETKTIGGRVYRAGRSQHDRWLDALSTQVWIAGRGLIEWADVTVTDIDATIPVYRRLIEGVERRIQKLEAARRVIIKYEVARLGDAPWDVMGAAIT